MSFSLSVKQVFPPYGNSLIKLLKMIPFSNPFLYDFILLYLLVYLLLIILLILLLVRIFFFDYLYSID